ncbi:MAG TPA: hypothetical protein VGD67_14075 [Pseudonocardiaceae bacterium]
MTVQLLTRSRPAGRLRTRLLHPGALRRAAATADLLDRIVDHELELVRRLPVHRRGRPVEKLAALVMLAQAYRHHAAGWIGRRELRRRSRAIFDRLAEFTDL